MTGHPDAPDVDRRAVADALVEVERRARIALAEVRSRRSGGVEERFRGLYVSNAHVDEALDTRDPEASRWFGPVHRDDASSRLGRLKDLLDLDDLDVTLLIIALAPDLDRRFETVYGYLNDEVTQRRATVGLALTLAGLPSDSPDGRARLDADARLRHTGLLDLDATERPVLSRELRVPDRVTAFLLGDDRPEAALLPLLYHPGRIDGPHARRLSDALRLGARLTYLREGPASCGAATATGAALACGRGVVPLDLRRITGDSDLAAVLRAAHREAGLRGSIVVAGPIEALRHPDRGPLDDEIQRLTDTAAPTVLHGSEVWDPDWTIEIPLLLDADLTTTADRLVAAAEVLPAQALDEEQLTAALAPFRLGPRPTMRAAQSALMQARLDGRDVLDVALLRSGARSQNAVQLERLARRIEPVARWSDLVLPPAIERDVRSIVTRWRYREQVKRDWGLNAGTTRGQGVSALFTGPSGTGKTLSGEVIAGELGLDLYLVDLSLVIDKYIGETSKNLDRIFDAADRVNGVLLFDEADALFGRRSAVSDSKDRYANVEVAYLLQRMEAFEGIAILTTNLAGNLDQAFLRRLDVIADFVAPDADLRRSLWERKLPASLPRTDDVDLDVLAQRFALTGSEIASIVASAAFEAASDAQPVSMRMLVRATVHEHRKLQRAISPSQLRELDDYGPLTW